jgi:hypothetical protein
MARHKVVWQDAGREPKCAPNPAFPNGIDIDVSGGAERTCTVALEHPARRCGHYLVRCKVCGASVACTTAGRPDDPRSVKMKCKEPIQ